MKNGSKLGRPGLFAIKGILEEVRESDGFVTYIRFEAVKNRSDLRKYLDLLLELGWIRLWALSGIVRMQSYEITDKGKRFLELFPSGK